MACRRTSTPIALLCLALALACAGTPEADDAAPALEWDQAAVTSLAQELSTSVQSLLSRVRNVDTSSNPRQDRIRSMAQDTLQQLHTLTRQLANRLGNGDGRQATSQVVRRIMSLRNDMATLTRSAATGAEVDELLATADGQLQQLNRFYAAD